MNGPQILTRSMSVVRTFGSRGFRGQYHSRSDAHSKIACWALMFDLLMESSFLRSLVQEEKVFFGLNHEMGDWKNQRKKRLDLVVSTRGGPPTGLLLADLVAEYGVVLEEGERRELDALPPLFEAPVGSVLVAIEAKAAMTAHSKSRPRLYDELNSSHLTVHGAADQSIAVGLAMVNAARTFLSPDLNKLGLAELNPTVSSHQQPHDADRVIEKLKELPRRNRPGEAGFDALAIVVVDCANDGSNVTVVTDPPGLSMRDDYHYEQAVRRVANDFAYRFSSI